MLGVVYGDIGTSPIYALRECFAGKNPIPVTPDNVLGVLSLIFWTLLLVISLKYMVYVLRADNRGEGGTFALMALLRPDRDQNTVASPRPDSAWRSRRLDAVRRRDDYAGDLGAERGGRPAGGGARAAQLCVARSRCHPASRCSAVQRHGTATVGACSVR